MLYKCLLNNKNEITQNKRVEWMNYFTPNLAAQFKIPDNSICARDTVREMGILRCKSSCVN